MFHQLGKRSPWVHHCNRGYPTSQSSQPDSVHWARRVYQSCGNVVLQEIQSRVKGVYITVYHSELFDESTYGREWPARSTLTLWEWVIVNILSIMFIIIFNIILYTTFKMSSEHVLDLDFKIVFLWCLLVMFICT